MSTFVYVLCSSWLLMGYWKRTTLIKKRYETTVGHDSWVNLRNVTAGIDWVDERVLLNQNNFFIGNSSSDVQARQYYGLSFAVANHKGSNNYNMQIGIAKVNGGNPSQGLIVNSGIPFNANAPYTVFSGTYYAFFFMVPFNNKYNGLTSYSGFNVVANGNLIAQHFVSEAHNYLNNFVVAQHTGGWTGSIEIHPTGNRNFKGGYENAVIHNLFIYTQPVTFYPNSATLIAIEGDM